jgi:hypothetical protein
MHRYRIVARISLILFILNLVLAAPVVQEIHEARGDEMVVAGPSHDGVAETSHDGVAGTTQDGVAEPSHDGVAEPSHDAAAEPSHDAMASPHSALGDPTPHLSFDSSLSGHSWLLDRPTLSPDSPSWHDSPSSHDSDTTPSPSPPTETPPHNAEFFNENMIKKLKIFGGVTAAGVAISALALASLYEYHELERRDFEDSST